MRKIFVVLSLWIGITNSAPTLAQEQVADDGNGAIELWNGLTTHSTKKEFKAFKAAQPRKKVEIISGCSAEMGYRAKKKRLVSIIFAGLDRDADCHRRLLQELLERPDEPEVKNAFFGTGGISRITEVEGAMLIWRDGKKKTKLLRTPGRGYNLIFTVRDDKYDY